ncbi:alpha-amylase family protein [Bifidobacterium sp. ESL0769]|uniref:alpha-amylase family protein n=1 Tax=Bifidobacterium sp. ESL0769 TaxID=2983229 RepID=UPI0023FA2B35|nr:alpha-amylase family protein [Bifidobacterium sp. ESL0769]WEV66664.1 alpha-amylase family protein [Bifidobacterium sp. ESL0769]
MNEMSRRIWWQVYPLGFCGAPVRPKSDADRQCVPRLDRLVNWLDYMEGMGCDGLLLGPIFTSETHGYDTVDFYTIDPRLGDDQTFDRLVTACHERGIALMLDGVFNHVGRDFPEFQRELKRAKDEMEAGKPIGHDSDDMFSFSLAEDGTLDYEKFEGHAILPAFNHEAPRVAELVGDVMTHWMNRGVDAWRLDAATTVPTTFWAKVLPRVRREVPNAWFMGEAIHGDFPQFVRDSTIDTVTQYELWKAIWSSLKDGNFFELDWCLKRHDTFLKTFTPQTFIGNHDVTRIASQIQDEEKLALAAVILFTVGGTPSVYYGDERAMKGEKTDGVGGDDIVRPEYPDTPEDLPDEGEWMYRLTRQLASMRSARPWMIDATTEPTLLENRHYAYDVRARDGSAKLHVDMDLDKTPHAEIYEGDSAEPLLHVEHRSN